MLTLIVSLIWSFCSLVNLAFKAVFMQVTVKEVKQAQDKAHAQAQLAGARLGNKIFWFSSILGFALLAIAYLIGIIKWWVVLIDCIVWVCGLIMNIVFIGYLKKQSK